MKKSFTVLAFLYILSPLVASASTQVLLGRVANTDQNATKYIALDGISSANSYTTANAAQSLSVLPVAGTFSNLMVYVNNAPTGTQKWTLALDDNGADQNLTCVIQSGATTCSDTAHTFTANAGDILSVHAIAANSPAKANLSYSIQFTPTTANQTMLLNGHPAANNGFCASCARSYQLVSGNYYNSSASADASKTILPEAGTLSAMYTFFNSAPGTSTSRTLALWQNSATSSSGLSVTVSGATQTVANNTASSQTVAAGDVVGLMAYHTGTPSGAGATTWSLGFTPDTVGDFDFINAAAKANDSTSTVGYYPLVAQTATAGKEAFSAEGSTTLVADTLTMSGISVAWTAPGSGKSRTFMLRKNGADTACTVTLSNTDTKKSATCAVSVNQGDTLDTSDTPTGAPTAGSGTIAYVASASSTTFTPLIITSPASSAVYDATTSSFVATYAGATTPFASVFVKGAATSSTAADSLGNWTMPLGLSLGTSTLSFTATDGVDATSSPVLIATTILPTSAGYTQGPVPGSSLLGANDVYVSGQYAYVASRGAASLSVYDISNPANLVFVASTTGPVPGTSLGGANFIAPVGHYLYVTLKSPGSGLAIIDISDPTNPTWVGTVADPALETILSGMVVSGNYAYVSTQNGTEVALDVSDPASPVVLSTLNIPGALALNTGMFISGNYLYQTDENACAMDIIDISNPSSMAFVASTTGPIACGPNSGVGPVGSLGFAHGVSVQGNYAFVVSGTAASLAAIDISNPASPQWVASTTGPIPGTSLAGANQIWIFGKYAYITDALHGAFSIVDISDPSNPRWVAETQGTVPGVTLDNARNMYIIGNYAYIADKNGAALAIVDIAGSVISR